ncbi:MAG: protein translocase SEC61 complex subunit gamma [Methanobacteriota archaeon]|jgi:protein transport protein SEC61 subunit gamma-like protein|nr:MAG: protein translocase SEC61 complex subunit gamma [Euryarchaeota archaeon]HIG20796.1 protein translocase SEC61 complex subunit gamma [Candidatus Poseidoniales archaeon]
MASEDSTSKSFEDRVQARQDQFETWVRSFGRGSWARIVRMARKPTKMEFRQTIWVCGIGMFVLGFIGFVMLWLMDTELPKFFQWLIG